MLKKTITYENFNGEKVTEDFYFNINALEYVRLTAKYGKDLQEYRKRTLLHLWLLWKN